MMPQVHVVSATTVAHILGYKYQIGTMSNVYYIYLFFRMEQLQLR